MITYNADMFERCLYFNVNALSRTVNRIWNEAFAEFGLSPSHAYLLRLVIAEPGLTPRQISLELKLEKSTITRFLDAMQKTGFIRRQKGVSGDAREQGIYPTKKSEQIASQLEETGNALYQKMMASIGESELKSLVSKLRDTETQLN